MANPVQRIAQGVDRFHQRRRSIAFPYAVVKKFGDDQGGNLAAVVAYYGFFSLFPLLLVFVTVLGIALRNNTTLQRQILGSALKNFPIVGSDLQKNVHSLSAHTTLSLVIGIVLTLWAGLGVVRAMETALNTVWNVPYKHRPNFIFSVLRALVMLAVLGVTTVLSAAAGGVGTGSTTWWWWVVGILASLLLNFALFMLAFRILTAADVSWADVRPGAIVGAVAWTTLQALGGYYVGHQLNGASSTYGTFAIVIGLLAWMYLGAQITLYAAEINVVKVHRLWPRSMVQPPLTEADRRELERLAKVEERRKDQTVETEIPQDGQDMRDEEVR
jgi:YihY family inner membrane protein